MKHRSKFIPLIISSIAALCFLALAFYIFNPDLTNFQHNIFNFIEQLRNPQLNQFMIALTKTSNPLSIIIITLIISGWLFFKKYPRESLFSLFCIISTALTNTVLKHIYLRERPSFDSLIEETGFSFPSGHSMISLSLALLISYLAFHLLSKKWLAYLMTLIGFSYALLIGFSRVYISVHYVGDVLGGWLATISVFSLLIYLFNEFYSHKKRNYFHK